MATKANIIINIAQHNFAQPPAMGLVVSWIPAFNYKKNRRENEIKEKSKALDQKRERRQVQRGLKNYHGILLLDC